MRVSSVMWKLTAFDLSISAAFSGSACSIRSIYEALENMGFEKGNVLEPAMGIGNFFGMLPGKMQESRLYGVELDGITGRIAKVYPIRLQVHNPVTFL